MGAGMTVTVRLLPLPVKTRLHGLVTPEHVDGLAFVTALHPPNVEPAFAVAWNVTVAALFDVVIFGVHVPETVCDVAGAPVPPHVVGASTVPALTVTLTVPVPVPANVKFQFRASVIVVCAVAPELKPRAPTINFMSRS